MKNLILTLALIIGGLSFQPHEAAAQEQFIGEVRVFAGNFAPRGWAKCEGQLLPIAQNSALFSLLGTYYGGDGRTTFGLPDLRGRSVIGTGAGPGLAPVTEGRKSNQGAKGNDGAPALGLTYIIATTGVYPSRN